MIPAADPRRLSRQALFILTGMNLLNYIDRYVIAALEESLHHDLGLSDVQYGRLFLGFILVYSFTSPWFGALGDRVSRPRLIALGVAVWSLATALGGLATGFLSLFLARAAVGVGEAAYATIGPTVISDSYARSERGRAFAVFYCATPIGSALGYLLGGWIDHHLGWRAAFLLVGLPGLLLALLVLRVKDPPRGQHDADEPRGRPAGGWRGYLPLLGNRPYRLTVLGYTALTFATGGLAAWAPGFLERERGFSRVHAATGFGAIAVAAGFLGTFGGGFLADHLRRRMRQADLWISGVAALLAVPLAWVALTAADRTVLLGAMFLAEVLIFASTGPINVVLISVVPSHMRAMAMAGSIFTIHVLGDAISPEVIGRISQASSLSRGVLVVPFAVLLAALVWIYTAWRDPSPPDARES